MVNEDVRIIEQRRVLALHCCSIAPVKLELFHRSFSVLSKFGLKGLDLSQSVCGSSQIKTMYSILSMRIKRNGYGCAIDVCSGSEYF